MLRFLSIYEVATREHVGGRVAGVGGSGQGNQVVWKVLDCDGGSSFNVVLHM